jgi:hypothetical protein
MFESGATRRHVRDLYKVGLTLPEICERLQTSKIWTAHIIDELTYSEPSLETRHYLARHGTKPTPRVEARFVCVQGDHAEPATEWNQCYVPDI